MNQRPVIAPGLPVLTRPDGELQIGLSTRHRLRIGDSAVARRTLASLARGERLTDQEGRRLLPQLVPALRDGDALVQSGLAGAEMAALCLRHPGTVLERVAARRSTAVRVVGDLGTAIGPSVGADPHPLIAASGLGTSDECTRSVTLVLAAGEPDRTTLDPMLRARQPHLLLRAVEGEVVLGPFVDPGVTACLRCIDAHLAERDPLYPVLVSDAARLVQSSVLPEPVDTAVATIAIGWAVRDLVRYAEGDPVSTWSATVALGPDQVAVAPRPWMPHPACGCGWVRSGVRPEGAPRSSTMGA